MCCQVVCFSLEQGQRVSVSRVVLCTYPELVGSHSGRDQLVEEVVEERVRGGGGALVNAQCMDAVASAKKKAWPPQSLRRKRATSLASHSASADVAATLVAQIKVNTLNFNF